MILKHFTENQLVLQELLIDSDTLGLIEKIIDVITACYEKRGKVLILGNGGSAADAQHFAGELVSRFYFDRPGLAAFALTTDSSVLTAIGNDYGYDLIFSRQLAGKATVKDIFLGITTSGKSQNILKALEQCRIMDIPSIVFVGHDGGLAKTMADHFIIAPGVATSTIQELHIVLAHTLCECVEVAIFGE